MSERYCRFARKRRYVCNHEPEEITTGLGLLCRVVKLVNQQDLIIEQNKAIIAIMNQTSKLLAEPKDAHQKRKLPINSHMTERG